MAYDINLIGGYGTGALGDVTDPAGQICSYANVVSVTEVVAAHNAVTINAPSNGAYETFEVGAEIMLHVSGCSGGDTAEWLGAYMVCKITAVQTSVLSSAGKILVIDKNITNLLPIEQFSNHIVQVITVPQFNTLTITDVVSPIAYDVTNKYGGILPIKCKQGLILRGVGAINLVDKGIPIANKALRYWTKQESAAYNTANVTVTTSGNGLLDTDKYSAWENHITVRQLLLNAGDGACVVWAKRITNKGGVATTRIGGTAAGAHYTRTNNLGGSTIMLVADDMDGFVPSLISKTKGTGLGLGRCYIALKNGILRNDEGLYAFDLISDPLRVMQKFNLKNFGSGRHGDVTNPTQALNNYAQVTNINDKTITYANLTTTGLADFDDGALVIVHISKHHDDTNMSLLGKFMFAKVIHHYAAGCNIVLDSDVTKILSADQIANYDVQIISVFEPSIMSLSTQHTATTKWDDTKKTGGLCVVACQGLCDIKGGGIIVTNAGGGKGAEALDYYTYFGNAHICDRLPIGSQGGSVLLIAQEMDGNDASRLGNTYDGSLFSGVSGGGGGAFYPGVSWGGSTSGQYGGYIGGNGGNGAPQGKDTGPGGAGAVGCKRPFNVCVNAHLLIIANRIKNCNIKYISTGGVGGTGGPGSSGYFQDGNPGGTGQPGGSGYPGGAGGGGGGGAGCYGSPPAYAGAPGQPGQLPGYCFIYCNQVDNFDPTGVIAV